jgi:tetratricopeptide (TPR) repeat protein
MTSELLQHFVELRETGRHEEAIREYRALAAAAKDANERADLLAGAEIEYCILGRLAEARQIVDELLAMETSDPEIRLSIEFDDACLLLLEGRTADGAEAFASMLQRHRELLERPWLRFLYEEIQWRRAVALVELRRFGEALPILQEAVSFDLEDVEHEQRVWVALGDCLYDAKDFESAREAFIRAIDFGLKNAIEEVARYDFAQVCVKTRGFAQARQQLETILRDFPTENSFLPRKYVYVLLSRACSGLGDRQAAESYTELAKRL